MVDTDLERALEELYLEAELAVCLGAPVDAVASAAKLAEGLLKGSLGLDPDARMMLGELIGEAGRQGAVPREVRRRLDHLNRTRNQTLHFRGRPRRLALDEARAAVEDAAEAAVHAGVLTKKARRRLAREARRRAARPPGHDPRFHLDRTYQKGQLGELLVPHASVLVFVAHGETEQGHDDLCELAYWRFRRELRGEWRSCEVMWPPPEPSNGTRFGWLVASLGEALLGEEPELPRVDPLTAEGEAAWSEAIDRLARAVSRSPDHRFVRHTVGRPAAPDEELARLYLERVLEPLSEVVPGFFAVGLKAQRTEPVGWPLLSRAWWVAHRDRRHVRRLLRSVEEHPHGERVVYLTLSELLSVEEPDLRRWLERWGRLDRTAAGERARELLARSRGGRWEALLRSLELFGRTSEGRTRRA